MTWSDVIMLVWSVTAIAIVWGGYRIVDRVERITIIFWDRREGKDNNNE